MRTRRPPRLPRLESRNHMLLIAAGVAAHEHSVLGVGDRQARLAVVMGGAARHPTAARLSPVEGLGNGFSSHGAPRLDHCRMEKNPVTFSTICRASSRVSSRPRHGCHSAVVRSTRLSLAALDGFTEDLTAGSAPLRASGLMPMCLVNSPARAAEPLSSRHLRRLKQSNVAAGVDETP